MTQVQTAKVAQLVKEGWTTQLSVGALMGGPTCLTKGEKTILVQPDGSVTEVKN